MGVPDRAQAEQLDRDDALARWRDAFVIDRPERLYLDGNSLGRLPRATVARLRQVVEEEWGGGLVGSWNRWIDWARQGGDLLSTAVVGGAAGEAVIADSTTVNLYKALVAALDARPGRRAVVTDDANFPSDRYVVQGLADSRGLDVRWLPPDPTVDDVGAAVDTDVALVTLSHVAFTSGALLDLAGITRVAHAAGALVVWDLSHSAGVVPVDLSAAEVDLAVGCTYKYLNGGPGSPAFAYVGSHLVDELRQPIWGWFGRRDQFEMGARYDAAPGIDRWLVGTPPVLALAAAIEGIGVTASAGVGPIRSKSVRLVALLEELADAWLAPLGFEQRTPRGAPARGSHLALAHPEAWRLCRVLNEQYDVVADFRPPDVVRLGLAPLYTRFVDVWDAAERIRAAAEARAWERVPHDRPRVT
ncbi:MAG TPA: aminotransferase class V-fold PLP-dependent enzyme [Acidimicrobiales bacterium]|nr:aminotransferase class V-fold PLP-dependent enzyme [Acidimicrobiales bacterium]